MERGRGVMACRRNGCTKERSFALACMSGISVVVDVDQTLDAFSLCSRSKDGTKSSILVGATVARQRMRDQHLEERCSESARHVEGYLEPQELFSCDFLEYHYAN